jgi:hypothetical protein
MTPADPRGYTVGLRGAWRAPNAFDLDYVEPAGSNAFTMNAEFEEDRVRLSVRDRTGLYGEHVIVGRRTRYISTGRVRRANVLIRD